MRAANFSPFVAALTAGPIFLLCLGAEMLYAEVPHPIPVSARELAEVGLALPLAAMVGFFIAILPSAFATAILVAVGEACEAAREPFVWVGIGLALGTGLGHALAGPASNVLGGVLPWAVTSAWTAWMCRRTVTWE